LSREQTFDRRERERETSQYEDERSISEGRERGIEKRSY
jgi:hypothetical protein